MLSCRRTGDRSPTSATTGLGMQEHAMQVRANLTLLRFHQGLAERDYIPLTVEASLDIDEHGVWTWSQHAVHPNEYGIAWDGLTERERAAAMRNLAEAFMCLDDGTIASGYSQVARKARRRNDLRAPRPWWVGQQRDGSFSVYAPSRFRGGAPIVVATYLCEEDARQIAWASTAEQVSPEEQARFSPAVDEVHS